ncbi:MAG: SDR family oxidoreductase, partial [Firmicutes bacterium]|nr:SDR family oxidoreductase [Bacillota bacterium]
MITGASQGIGLATARTFLSEGARVAICARDHRKLEEAYASLSALGEVFVMQADAQDPASLEAFAQAVDERYGGIDCWVNNVGASIPRKGALYT